VEYVARPLINQSKLIGILYLENNLASRVFTPARIAVLKLLASQAAISLENTRLYRDLAQREAKIRRLVDANIVGIFIGNLDGDIAEANEAFLRMLGYTREDLVSGRLRWTDLTPEELRERDQRAAAELRDDRHPPTIPKGVLQEGRQACPGAGLRWLSEDTPNLDETSKAIRRIVRDEKRATAVISRMRALFKKTPTEKEPLDLNDAGVELGRLTPFVRGSASGDTVGAAARQ
jgi:PAS domain S-box-containing protein